MFSNIKQIQKIINPNLVENNVFQGMWTEIMCDASFCC